jgi:hypothetical protein
MVLLHSSALICNSRRLLLNMLHNSWCLSQSVLRTYFLLQYEQQLSLGLDKELDKGLDDNMLIVYGGVLVM